jgi:hypothetical protein
MPENIQSSHSRRDFLIGGAAIAAATTLGARVAGAVPDNGATDSPTAGVTVQRARVLAMPTNRDSSRRCRAWRG